MPNGTRTGISQSTRSHSHSKTTKANASKATENYMKDAISKDGSDGMREIGNKVSVLEEDSFFMIV